MKIYHANLRWFVRSSSPKLSDPYLNRKQNSTPLSTIPFIVPTFVNRNEKVEGRRRALAPMALAGMGVTTFRKIFVARHRGFHRGSGSKWRVGEHRGQRFYLTFTSTPHSPGPCKKTRRRGALWGRHSIIRLAPTRNVNSRAPHRGTHLWKRFLIIRACDPFVRRADEWRFFFLKRI